MKPYKFYFKTKLKRLVRMQEFGSIEIDKVRKLKTVNYNLKQSP